MYRKLIPCLYFPTTVIAVDDEQRLLDSLSFQLENKKTLKLFNCATKALHFLNHEYQPEVFAEHWILKPDAEPDFQNYVREYDIDIWGIHEEIFNAKRFNQIAVVVADYAMPNMDGITFFKNLEGTPYKRILLTGEASEKIAINAFNNGLINRYIRKDDPNYLNELQVAMSDLEAEYFQSVSEIPLAHLKNNCRFRTCCLDNPCFVKFFNDFLKDHTFTEYYLAGPTGSFLFLDRKGNCSWLVVKDAEQMQFYTEIADETSSRFVRNALQTRQYVPYFYNHRDDFPPTWDDYLYPAKKIKGEVTDYYVSYINQPTAYLSENSGKKIYAYEDFLRESCPQISVPL